METYRLSTWVYGLIRYLERNGNFPEKYRPEILRKINQFNQLRR